MKIRVRPIGIVKKFVEEQDVELDSGLTSRDLIDVLKLPVKLKVVSYVNGNRKRLDDELNDGDEIKLVTMLKGG